MADDTGVPSGGRSASDYRDIADTLRGRVDLFGKSLGAIATAGIAAVGLGNFSSLFPTGDNVGWAIAACIGLAAAAFGAIGIAARLMNVARPVFMQVDLDGSDVDANERLKVEPVYRDAARRFGYTSLQGLELRERSLRRSAGRATDDVERARRAALADEVKSEIEQALARAQVVVIRKRATDAVGGWIAALLYVCVVAGLIVFAVGANKIPNDRNDPIAKAKACADARKAGATANELSKTNDICDAVGASAAAAAAAPSPEDARAQVAAALVTAMKTCAALVHQPADPKSGPLAAADCAPIGQAIAGLTK